MLRLLLKMRMTSIYTRVAVVITNMMLGDIGLLHAFLTKDLIDNDDGDGGDDNGSVYGDYDYADSDDEPDDLDVNYFANIASTQL